MRTWLQQLKVHFRISTLVDCTYIYTHRNIWKIYWNEMWNLISHPSSKYYIYIYIYIYTHTHTYTISIFCVGNGGRVLLPKTQSFKDFVWEKNCLCLLSCMCVLTYSVRNQINFLFTMWKLYWTRKDNPSHNQFQYIGLFVSPSGISELDCATTKTDTAERSISIGRESLQVFFFVLGDLAYFQVPSLGGSREKNGVHSE